MNNNKKPQRSNGTTPSAADNTKPPVAVVSRRSSAEPSPPTPDRASSGAAQPPVVRSVSEESSSAEEGEFETGEGPPPAPPTAAATKTDAATTPTSAPSAPSASGERPASVFRPASTSSTSSMQSAGGGGGDRNSTHQSIASTAVNFFKAGSKRLKKHISKPLHQLESVATSSISALSQQHRISSAIPENGSVSSLESAMQSSAAGDFSGTAQSLDAQSDDSVPAPVDAHDTASKANSSSGVTAFADYPSISIPKSTSVPYEALHSIASDSIPRTSTNSGLKSAASSSSASSAAPSASGSTASGSNKSAASKDSKKGPIKGFKKGLSKLKHMFGPAPSGDYVCRSEVDAAEHSGAFEPVPTREGPQSTTRAESSPGRSFYALPQTLPNRNDLNLIDENESVTIEATTSAVCAAPPSGFTTFDSALVANRSSPQGSQTSLNIGLNPDTAIDAVDSAADKDKSAEQTNVDMSSAVVRERTAGSASPLTPRLAPSDVAATLLRSSRAKNLLVSAGGKWVGGAGGGSPASASAGTPVSCGGADAPNTAAERPAETGGGGEQHRLYRALADYLAVADGELSVREGDVLQLLAPNSNSNEAAEEQIGDEADEAPPSPFTLRRVRHLERDTIGLVPLSYLAPLATTAAASTRP